ncbi:MFS transporter [Streptomyces orinoci]|uniref:MFS transporter n=1 Tax=Streptomyces orinoci TaxID=67339 RepID=A0ABV3JRU2_STRON|nr:MFS transporter [Streptomyces orinoci]
MAVPGSPPDHPVTPPLFSRAAVVASCAGFVVIGALQALYGPAIPALRKEFGIVPAVAGLSLSAHFIGALLGVLVFHVLRGRAGNRQLLGGSYALMAAGAVIFALASAWPLALAGAFITGLGFGGIDYGLNQLFSLGFGNRSTAMLNLLNAHFGIGAVAGPALVGWLGARHYPWIFGAMAVISVLLMCTLGGVAKEEPAPEATTHTSGATSRVLPLVAAFIGVYVFHVAIETGVGGWEPTHLETFGYGASAAATATSAYWLAMTVGRFAAVPVTLRFSAPAITIVCCLGMAGFLLLATIPDAAPYAYIGVGLMIAPIFPTCLPWLNRSVPTLAGAGAYVIAASMIGGVAFPPLLGVAIDVSGVKALPVLLFALAMCCVLLSLWLTRATSGARHRTANPPPAPAASADSEVTL